MEAKEVLKIGKEVKKATKKLSIALLSQFFLLLNKNYNYPNYLFINLLEMKGLLYETLFCRAGYGRFV